MSEPGFAVFETALGICAIAWRGRGIVGVQLPEGSEAATAARIRRRFPDLEPCGLRPREVESAIVEITALLLGEPRSLVGIELDLTGMPEFSIRVYRQARQILPGSTTSYGRLAEAIGAPGEARAVGQALGRNPVPIIVPCHRILGAGGKAGGFSGGDGVSTKLAMLTIERARTAEAPSLFSPGELPFKARRGR